MHHLARTYNLSAERLGQGLVTETDAEDGDLAREAADGGQEIPASFGVQGPGRSPGGVGRGRAISSRLSSSLRFTSTSCPRAPEILHQVPGEGVVVVDE